MSEENVAAHARITVLMRCLVEQNAVCAGVLQDAVETTEKITDDISAAVVGLQFQDLAKQRLANVTGALDAIAAAVGALQHETMRRSNLMPPDDRHNQEWAEAMIARCTLSEVRNRLADHIAGHDPSRSGAGSRTPATGQVAGNTVELF
jgi:methyl-accepting chemotaxis protein